MVGLAVLAVTATAVLIYAVRRPGAPQAGPTTPAVTTPAGTPTALPTSSPTPSPSVVPSPPRPSTSPTGAPSHAPSSAPGVPGVPAHLRGKDVETIPTSQPVVALTFDAGANADGLPAILGTLAAKGVRGTFFVTGGFAAGYPGQVRAIVAGGHRLGNHSATHPHFPALSDAQMRDQLTRAADAIRAAGGTDPRPLFRFPFGDRTVHTIGVVNAAGYVCVRWTVDTLGWQGTGSGITTTTVLNRVLNAARPGEIVLMHVGSNPDDHSTLDADALPAVIDQLRGRGYRFVALDALLTG